MNICVNCHKEFEPRIISQFKFCSSLCREKYYRANKLYYKNKKCPKKVSSKFIEKKCPFCGNMFETNHNRQVYCDLKCKIKAAERRHKARAENSKYASLTANEQLCWSCQRCYGAFQCVWAESGTPVKGWTATPSTIYENGYRITACPEYIQDEEREFYKDCEFNYHDYFDSDGNWKPKKEF